MYKYIYGACPKYIISIVFLCIVKYKINYR